MKKFLFFTIIFAGLCDPTLVAAQTPNAPGSARNEVGRPFMATFTLKDYPGDVQTWAFVQDRRGVIYAGNQPGVLEYDGASWRMIPTTNNSFVRSLAIDDTGRIYVGAQADFGYLAPDAAGQLHYVSLLRHIPEAQRSFSYVWTTLITDDGVYFQTREHLFRFNQEDTTWSVKICQPQTSFDFAFWFGGTYYVHQGGIGFSKMVNDSLHVLPGGEQFANDRVQVMLPADDSNGRSGKFLLGTFNRGFFLFDGQSFRPFKTEADVFLRNGTLYNAAILTDGAFALATISGGAVIIDRNGRIRQYLNNANGLTSNSVLSVFVDRSGALWLGPETAIQIVETPSPLSKYTAVDGLDGTVSILIRYKGVLYAGTSTGPYYLDSQSSRFKAVTGLLPGNAQTFGLTIFGDKLLVASGTGLYEIVGNHAQIIKRTIGLKFSPNFVHRSQSDSSLLFCAGLDGLYAMHFDRKRDQWQDEGIVAGVHEYVASIIETEPGELWLGTNGAGVFRVTYESAALQDAKAGHFGVAEGLAAGGAIVRKVMGKPIFISNTGIYRFEQETNAFRPDSTLQIVALGTSPINYNGVTEDHDGNLWVNLGAETAVMRKQPDGSFRVEKSAFQRFTDTPTAFIYPEKDGVVWFGTNESLIRYDPSIQKNYAAPFTTLIRRVFVGEDSLLYGGAPLETSHREVSTLAYSDNTLRFEFAAPTYDNPRETHYQFMLEGFDEHWSAWHRNTQKEYTNLSAGSYRFRVRAKNIYQHESSEAVYEFKILPPWYRTVWAYLFYLLAAGGFVLGLIRIRTRQLKARQRELEQTVEERTQEIQQKVNELAIINSVGSGLAKQLDFQAIVNLVGDKIRDIFKSPTIYIALHERKSNLVHFPYYLELNERIKQDSYPLGTGLTSHVIKTCRPLLIVENAERRFTELGAVYVSEDEVPKKSWLGVPILMGEVAIGVITLQDVKEYAYTEADVRLLSTLAANMGVALENARLFDETNRLLKDTEARAAELAIINKVGEGLAQQLDFQGIIDLVGDKIVEVFKAQVASISLYEPKGQTIHHRYVIERGERFYFDKPKACDHDRLEIIQSRKPLVFGTAEEMIARTGEEVIAGEFPKSYMGVPIILGQEATGVVTVQDLDREHAFGESDVRLLVTLASNMGVALENARLFDETKRLLKESEQRNAELAVINGVQEGLVRELDMQGIYDLVGNRLTTLFDIQVVIIRTFDHDAGLEHWQFAFEKGERLQSAPRPFNWANRQLIRTRQPMLINEKYVATAQKFGGKGVTVGEPPKSAVFMPLLVGDTVKGSISLQNVDRENAFSESDVRLLSTLANSMSVALENARLFHETNRLLADTKQRAAELATVNSISEALASQLKQDDLIQLVGEQIRQVFRANIVYVALLDKATNMIQFPYSFGEDAAPITLGEGLTSQIIRTGKPLLINEDVDASYTKLGIADTGAPAESYLGVPIPVGSEVIGVISAQSSEQENRFTEADLRLLNTIAANVGVALHNARLFEETQEARAVAEEANEAKSSFLSTVSHELRTPLTSVLGFAKIIKKRLEEKIFPLIKTEDSKVKRTVDQVAENLNVVVAEGERLTSLINNVLDLAKIEAGKIEWHMEKLNVPEIIERATAATASLFDSSDLKLKKEVDASLPEIVGDQDKLIQVVINLISNAVKFTDKGSVTCRAKQRNGEIVVSIIDTGMGIAPEDQPKVFEKFKQVGETLTNKPKGTGLGLTICREIVEHHGGRIWVESEMGVGSTFAFALPIKTEAEHGGELAHVDFAALMAQLKQRMQTTAMKPRNGAPTILVVDDDASIRELLNQNLHEAGYQVRVANNGREALEQVRREPPDLIILDVMMPEMNGFDVAAVLKNDPVTMDIPILILSIVQDRERGFRLGIDRYLTKPIDTEALFREVGSLLQQGKSHRKVMVVDEDASTVKTLAEVLQARGYHVVETNGAELIKKAVSEKPDIIILNSVLSEKQDVVRTLRFENGLEDVLFLVYQ